MITIKEDVPIDELIHKSYNIAKERASELSKLYHSASSSSGATKGHLLLAQRSYKALSTILYASISIAQIEDLEKFIKKSSVRLPQGLFDLDEWMTAMEASLLWRNKEMKRIVSSYIDDDIRDLKKALQDLASEAEDKMLIMKNDIKNAQKQLMPILKADEEKIKSLELNNKLLNDEVIRLSSYSNTNNTTTIAQVLDIENLEQKIAIEIIKNQSLSKEIESLKENINTMIKNNEANDSISLQTIEYQRNQINNITNELNEQFEAKTSQLIQMYDDKIITITKQYEDNDISNKITYERNLAIEIEKLLKDNDDRMTAMKLSMEEGNNLKLLEKEKAFDEQLLKYKKDIMLIEREKDSLLSKIDDLVVVASSTDHEDDNDTQSLEEALRQEKEQREQQVIENSKLLEKLESLNNQHNMEIMQLQLLGEKNVNELNDKAESVFANLKASNDEIIRRLLTTNDEKDKEIAALQRRVSGTEQAVSNDKQSDELESVITMLKSETIDAKASDAEAAKDSLRADLEKQIEDLALTRESLSTQLEAQSAQIEFQATQLQGVVDASATLRSSLEGQVTDLTSQLHDANASKEAVQFSMETQIEDLNRLLQEAKSSKDGIQSLLDASLSEDSNQFAEEINKYLLQVSDLSAQVNDIKAAKDTLQSELERQIDDLTCRLRDMASTRKSLSSQVEEQSAQLEMQAEQLHRAFSIKGSLQSSLDGQVADLTAQLEEFAPIKSELAETKLAKESLEARVLELSEESSARSDQVIRLSSELQEARNMIETLGTSINELTVSHMEQTNALTEKLTSNEKDREELLKEVESIRADSLSSESQLLQANSDIEKLTEQLKEKESMTVTMTVTMETQQASFETKLHDLEVVRDSLEVVRDSLTSQLQSANTNEERLSSQLLESNREKGTVESSLKELQTTYSNLVEQNESSNSSILQLQQQIESLESTVQDLRIQVAELTRSNTDITSQLHAAIDSKVAVDNLLSSIMTVNTTLEKTIKSMSASLDATSAQIVPLQTKCDELKSIVISQKEQVDRLQSSLDDAEAKLGVRKFDSSYDNIVIPAARKIQKIYRGWITKKNYKQYLRELVAIRSGVLAAKKYTIQGESGWYKAPDELIYYFTQDNNNWNQICGPMTEEDYISNVENSFKKKKTLTMTKVDFDLRIHHSDYQVCMDEVDKRLYVCTPIEDL